MKGLVLISYLDFVENTYGIKVLNQLIELNNDKNNSSSIYTSLNTYEDSEAVNLMTLSSEIMEINIDAIEFEFGKFFFLELLNKYRYHFEKSNIKEFLIHLENYIHPEIDMSIDGAITPKFILKETKFGFELAYTSQRKMKHFAHGLLLCCNEYYRDKYSIQMEESHENTTCFKFIL